MWSRRSSLLFRRVFCLLGMVILAFGAPMRSQSAGSRAFALLGPVITFHPENVAAAPGEYVTLRSGASGFGFLAFQWYFNGVPIPGETAPTLILASIRDTQFGSYSVRVTDVTGTSESLPAMISREAPSGPGWLVHPRDVTARPGESITLEAVATGQPPFTYQWRLNGNNVPGATNATLEIPSVQPRDGGRYTLIASNPQATLESRPAFVSITLPMLRMTDLFENRAILMEPAWSGTTNNLEATSEVEAGERRHAGKRGGSSMWLTWRAPASGRVDVSTAGSDFDTLLAVYSGDSLGTLVEVASDDDSAGFLTSTLSFTAVANAQYHVAIDGFAGAQGIIVLNWTLLANAPPIPRIITGPQSETFVASEDLLLSVAAEGEGLTYEWLFNGVPIGVASPSLTVPNLTPERAGYYSVRITSASGQTVESVPALIEVVSGPSASAADKLDDLFEEPAPGLAVTAAPGAGGFTSVSPGLPGWRETTNENAQRSPEDPIIFGEIGGASLWLRFRATANGWMRLDTEGSAIPTVLGVYTNRTSPQPIAEARPQAPATHCKLFFGAFAGEDYLVMIDGVSGAQGAVRLGYSMELAVVGPPTLRFADGTFSIEQAVPPGRYEIAAGTALQSMTPMLSTNVTSGVLRVLDESPGTARRFYRIQGVP